MDKHDPARCPLSGARIQISVAQEIDKKARCPRPNGCGRVLGIRPSRQVTRRNPDGQPEATLPQHRATP